MTTPTSLGVVKPGRPYIVCLPKVLGVYGMAYLAIGYWYDGDFFSRILTLTDKAE